MSDSPFLIVGLGNPGPQYADTRHNLGFLVIEELARRWPEVRFAQKFHAQCAQVSRGPHRVWLMMPQTYMNRSGLSVGEASTFFKIDRERRLLVIYDDLDTPVGGVRIRAAGGSGGHNGMRSIIESIGGEAFPRIRIGIGRQPGIDYVLGKIPKAERELYRQAVETSANAVETFIDEGLNKAMNTYNSRGKSDES